MPLHTFCKHRNSLSETIIINPILQHLMISFHGKSRPPFKSVRERKDHSASIKDVCTQNTPFFIS